MFVLVDKNSGGVYAVRDESLKERVVQIFSESDDAERYYGHLVAQDYKRQLRVMEIEEGDVKRNCNQFGYHYTIIQPDDIVIPPIHDNL